MATFAHTETGIVLDAQCDKSMDDYKCRYGAGPQRPNENDEAYAARLEKSVAAKWKIVEVPEGTEHGAKDNGDGTFTNPQPPVVVPVPPPPATTKQQILDQIAVLKSLADQLP